MRIYIPDKETSLVKIRFKHTAPCFRHLNTLAHLLHKLLNLHDKPLLLVGSNGLIHKCNKAADLLWPALNENAHLHLWELGALEPQQALELLEKFQSGKDGQKIPPLSFQSQTNESGYYLEVIGQEQDIFLLETGKIQLSSQKLLTTTTLSPDILDALMNGISDQLLAVLDKDMRYIAFNEAYKKEYARIFAINIAPGDQLLDTLEHLPGEQEKAKRIWETALAGEEFSLQETFGHTSLQPTTYSLHFIPLKNKDGQLLGVLYKAKDITKEKMMEVLLRDSEERFRTLAESTPDIVVRYSPDMQVLFANSAVEHELEVAPAALISKNLFDAPNASKISEGYFLKARQALSSGQEVDLISTYENNGVLKDYYTRFIPEKNAEGEVISVIAVSKNISDLQQAQKELQQARDFIFMAEIVPQIIWTTEANGNVSYFNKRWYDYTGLSIGESMHWGWQYIIHPEDAQETLLTWQHSLESEEPYQVEYRLRRHDGSYRWHLCRGMPLRNEEGQVIKWYGFCADVHEQRQNRTELAKLVQEYQLLNQMIPQIVWSTKPNGDHDYFNQRWYEYTGRSFEQSKDEGWSQALHPDDVQRTQENWKHCLATGETYQVEYRFKRFDGIYRWFIARATPLRDAKGNIIKWFGTCTDIHDQKQQSEALAQKNYELQQINNYLDQFVHTAAHDLRSPVANMKLLHEMFLREEKPEKKEKLLENFKPLLNRLDDTIIGLVEIVQMQEGHSALRVQSVNPLKVFEAVKEELSDMLEDAKAELQQKIVLEKPLYYLKPYLHSILRNLINNAIKYRDYSRSLHIEVKGEWKGKYYCLSVQDNGIGIDLQRNNKNLFRPFKRLSQQGQGLGIGLHLVQNMVSKNGGHIEVSSSPGLGSTFTVFLNPYEY
ncbi:PAS/PAC sensor hybrid histidine kinase [Flammeovirgaceae bacterium 311]|nr:PAS/PAC sensor hybrid histidine kinase [Flammeovirgaceae bacterium 311]